MVILISELPYVAAVYGVFVGRFSPFHLGHQAMVEQMVDTYGEERVVVIVGTSTQELTERTPFPALERAAIIHQLFPQVKIGLLPDYPTDAEWLSRLDEELNGLGVHPREAVFWGGTEGDLRVFTQAHRKTVLVDRASGRTPPVSATRVRELLAHHQSPAGLVDPGIIGQIEKLYDQYQIKRP